MHNKIILITRTEGEKVLSAVAIASDEAQAVEFTKWRGAEGVAIYAETVGESGDEPRLLAQEAEAVESPVRPASD